MIIYILFARYTNFYMLFFIRVWHSVYGYEELSTWHNYDLFSNSIPWYRELREDYCGGRNVRDMQTGVSPRNAIKGTHGLG